LRAEEILKELESLGDPKAVAGMARYGIRSAKVLGISVAKLRVIAKRLGRDQALAETLWRSGILEARIMASLIADPALVTEPLMESWAKDFDIAGPSATAVAAIFSTRRNLPGAKPWSGAVATRSL
jgi:3-methyladenine DNA glycosylase AlkD